MLKYYLNVLTRMNYANNRDRRGMGDAVQFNIVLKHIKKYMPSWRINVETTIGKDSCHAHLAEKIFLVEHGGFQGEFDKILDFKFEEPCHDTSRMCLKYRVPATKPTHSLIRVLDLEPDPELFNYEIKVDEITRRIAKKYIESLPANKGVVIIHYEASSSPHNKNMELRDVKRLIDSLLCNGYTPLMFDWRGSCPYVDYRHVFRADSTNSIWEGRGTMNAKVQAALIEQVRLFVGVDSGPLHIAGGVATPAIGFWKFHHPIHYYDFSNNVTHLVPGDARRHIKADDKHAVENFFNEKYKHHYYHNDRGDAVIDAVCRELGTERDGPSHPHADNSKKYPFLPVQEGQWWPMKVIEK